MSKKNIIKVGDYVKLNEELKKYYMNFSSNSGCDFNKKVKVTGITDTTLGFIIYDKRSRKEEAYGCYVKDVIKVSKKIGNSINYKFLNDK